MGLQRQPGCWLRSSHPLKECVIAHWSSDPAPKISGAKTYHRSYGIVEARSEKLEVGRETKARKGEDDKKLQKLRSLSDIL